MANSINEKLHTKITLLSIYLLLFSLVANSYNPDYNLAINCGSLTNTTALDKRMWVGDNIDNTYLFTFIEPKITNPSLNIPPNSISNTETPFTTARVSLSNFTYSFSSITNSPVFIRLHFYPTSYQNFEPTNAFFSVEVNNNLTLLKNFNPSLWTNDTITKEYCIQVQPNEKLNITFIPNSNPYYAFINGIEVVSMPSYLYYTDLDDPNYHIKILDLDSYEFEIRKDKALETVYRVNVGENKVQPSDDTGLFRDWDNDFPHYLEKEYPLSVSSYYGPDHLNYLSNTIPNYTAPETVYLTARSYGRDVTEDYNVTWNFEVDSAFTYMVRLHFCEFNPLVNSTGDRMFQIFIDDTFAEHGADVISWSGAGMVPVHKDYVVTMRSQRGSNQIERVNLSIKLHRTPISIRSTYRDVLLQRGTLRENLYGSDNEPLRWNQRLKILLGAARGLHYLHAGAKHNIIHRDVKSTNILLDEKWVAKVSDFGLSKVGPTGISMTHVSTMVKGSIGYLDPECYLRNRLTLKSDVYSFGVVLLEVLCARPPLDHSLDKKKVNMVALFKKCYKEGVVIEEMVDPFIKDSITSECLNCYCQMVLSCLHGDGNQRMSMSDVVGTLELCVEIGYEWGG